MKYIISSIWESPSWQWKNHSSIRCYLLLSFIYLSTVSSDSSDSCARWSGTGSGVDGSAGGGRGSVAPNESELFLASNTGKTWAKHDTMIHNAQNTINKKENEEKKRNWLMRLWTWSNLWSLLVSILRNTQFIIGLVSVSLNCQTWWGDCGSPWFTCHP